VRSDATAGERVARLVTCGCVVVLTASVIVVGTLVSWLSFRSWHDKNANSEHDRQARASILRQARATADDTVRALDTGGTGDADAVTGVIWRHSEAPVITYDASRREFTATAEKTAQYDGASMFGGGAVQVTRCFVFTYAHHPGRPWTSKVTERDRAVCAPGHEIAGLVRLTLTRVSGMHAQDMTQAGMRKALGVTEGRSLDVRKVVREGDMVSASILVPSWRAEATQCYRFTRPVRSDATGRAATAVPTSSCRP